MEIDETKINCQYYKRSGPQGTVECDPKDQFYHEQFPIANQVTKLEKDRVVEQSTADQDQIL